MNQVNFNSHPELSNQEFAHAALVVFNGPGIPVDDAGVQAAVSYIESHGGGAGGRYALIFDPADGWIAQGYSGNSDDNWFKNIPTWAWLIIVPIAVGAFAYLAWRAWGGTIKAAMAENGNGGSHGY